MPSATIESIYAEALEREPAALARAASAQSGERVSRLKESESRLRRRLKTLFDDLRKTTGSLDTALIEEGADVARLIDRLAKLEREHRAVSHASARILENLLPQAEIAALRASAVQFAAEAQVLREIAAERTQRTVEMMAEAAEFEGSIVFDTSQTISGSLQALAEELDRKAADHHRWADERQEKYTAMAQQIDALGAIRAL